MLEAIGQDIRYAARSLRASPAFSTVAILSLALGIGANTAIFSLIDAVILRSLPVQHPEELLQVDPSTGSSHPSVALRASPQACDDAGMGSQLASVGRDVFALIPTDVVGSAVLYRAAT